MSKIEKLIEEKCPNGVSFYALGEIAKIQRGDRITKKDITDDGEYPVMSGGVNPMGRYRMNNRNANTITISSYGAAGFVNFLKEDFWANDVCLSVFPKDIVDNKYLYYALKAQQQYIFDNTTKAIPDHIPTRFLEELMIPVPPLVIQKEIVGVLDSFTELETKLEAELEAELEARRKQYEYYRDQLLSFEKLSAEGGQVEWSTIGDLCDVYTGGEAPADSYKGKIPDEAHPYPIYSNGIGENALWGFSSSYTIDADAVTFSSIGTIGHPTIRHGKFTPIIRLKTIIPKNDGRVLLGYIRYALEIADFSKQQSSVPNINANMLKSIKVPVPSISVQQHIIDTLSQFDEVIYGIESGIPAEIEARHKQYVYYRDKLLAFKEKNRLG